ncbi:MAG: hypothetical protein WCN27_01740 [Alphaproteobacteria bacterium]
MSQAMPYGEKNFAFKLMAESEKSKLPSPAIVVTPPKVSIFRIRLLTLSAT